MRLFRLLLLLALGAALVAGCGSDSEDGTKADDSAKARLAAAADRTEKEETVRMRFDMDAKEGDEVMKFTGEGAMTSDSSRMRMKGTFEQGSEDPFEMDMIMIRDVVYMRSPAFDDLPGGKTWLKMVDKEAAPSTMTMGEFVEMLRATDDVEVVGGERVNGRQATHYKARLSFEELKKNSPPETAERLGKQLRGVDGELPVEAWIGEDDLIWRMAIDMDQDDLEGVKGEGHARITADMLEYGVKVDAEAPPASDVVDEGELGAN